MLPKTNKLNVIFCLLLISFISGCSDADSRSTESEDSRRVEIAANDEILKKLENIGERLEQIDEIKIELDKLKQNFPNPGSSAKLSNSTSAKPVSQDSQLRKTILNLSDASAIGDQLRVAELIKSGIDVNIKDESGKTALHHAALNGRAEVIKLLIDAGANVNELDNQKLTPLNRAQLIANKDAIELLLKNNAVASDVINPITTDIALSSSGALVLQAIEEDSLNLLKEQEGLGFDFNSQLPGDQNFLYAVAKNGSLNVLQYYLNKIYDPAFNSSGKDFIIEALGSMYRTTRDGQHEEKINKFRETIKILAEKFPELLKHTKDDYAPLHIAISAQDINMIKLLIELDADIEQAGPDGRSPLILAITTADHTHPGESDNEQKHGHQLEMSEILLNSGASVNSRGYKGRNALMESIMSGNSDLAKLMLNSGADANSVDDDGVTALHLAAYSGLKHICEELLSRKANKDAKVKTGPKKGLKPVDAAEERKHQDIVQLLKGN